MQHSMSLVGLDVHASQTHAAILDTASGELRRVRLRMAPVEVVGFLASLPGPVRAVYEAGPTGFWLARAGVEHGIDVRVVAAARSRARRAIVSRPTSATLSGWRGCWPPANCASRSCRTSPTSSSGM